MSRVQMKPNETTVLVHSVQGFCITSMEASQHIRDDGSKFTCHEIHYHVDCGETTESIVLEFYVEGHTNLFDRHSSYFAFYLEACEKVGQDKVHMFINNLLPGEDPEDLPNELKDWKPERKEQE